MRFNDTQMIRLGQGVILVGIVALLLPLGKVWRLPAWFLSA